MKLFNKIKNISLLLATGAVFLTACNKLELDPVANPQPAQSATPTLAALLDDPSFSILKAAVQKAATFTTPPALSILQQLSVPSLRFTVFAPDDAAFASSGISSPAILAGFTAGLLDTILRYHIVPQVIASSSIPSSFPNFQYPTILNPKPSVSALLRLTTFPSVRSGVGAWVNNIPIIATDIQAVNGVLHKVARVIAPPSTPLWSRIATDPDLTYLKAAIERADSGTVATVGTLNTNNLQSVLTEFGPNLTVFAPSNAAFQAVLYAAGYPAVYRQLYTGAYNQAISGGATPAQAAGIATAYATANAPAYTTGLISLPTIFQDTALFGILPAQSVKGILVYHILGSRAFSVNLPATPANQPTLLNTVVPSHPGVTLSATFTGLSVTAATVKGAANATAANIAINPTPNPNGTSDQHFINGVMHKIDQVLRPQ